MLRCKQHSQFCAHYHIVDEVIKLKNHLKNQTSPYLLQHVNNPVDWYPWCEEAFAKARKEEKPIFLSIGYSTCHWCHVMAHESFEDEEVARELNQNFIAIKVDKEERPDIDSIYMEVCLMLGGSGGWPASIFMTPEQKPFYAGTYFPKHGMYGRIGFLELLRTVHDRWEKNKNGLVKSAEEITRHLQEQAVRTQTEIFWQRLPKQGVEWFKANFDEVNGGFGKAPKFPMPHNLMFLMDYYQAYGNQQALEMAEKTLMQMYRGGIFDHIGGGFSRYSTDDYFLVPHFEKMLYDNALLLMSYAQAFSITQKEEYQKAARKTAQYIRREMTDSQGGFYSAQDADSDGVEGKYYTFSYEELTLLLGRSVGRKFNKYFNITRKGNFEGKSIPNRLEHGQEKENAHPSWEHEKSHTEPERLLPKVYIYRRQRNGIFLDDKILTSWNGLMIGAFARMFRVFGQEYYLNQAKAACHFLESHQEEPEMLFVSYRAGKCQGRGFLEDYAFYAFGLLELYGASLEINYLERAVKYCKKAVELFGDEKQGGFFLYGRENEPLITVCKETYDGAIPSGNSVMAYNFVKLWQITGEKEWKKQAERQLNFLASAAENHPAGYSFFLLTCLRYQNPPRHIVCVLKEEKDLKELRKRYGGEGDILILRKEKGDYKKINGKTTLYICDDCVCRPPINL